MGIQVGDRAPEFRVEALDQGATKSIGLDDCRGRWVILLFYPADFTFV